MGWIVQSLFARSALQISVAQNGDEAIVSGPLHRKGKSHVYATVKANDERIVAAVAYSMFREHFVADNPEFTGLGWQDFEALLKSVSALEAMKNRYEVSKEDYRPLYNAISQLIEKSPRSYSLLALGTDVSVRAEKPDEAMRFLNRTWQFLDKGDNYFQRYNLNIYERQRILSSCALEYVNRLNGGEATDSVFDSALAKHKALLNITEFQKKRDVSVAIISGVPRRDMASYPFREVGSTLGASDWITLPIRSG